ncbi:TfoX/Sxy family protein [Nocardioides sp.]|uniref:TfoX/Sxy family protein n=1 Tax=Nocardioides sp. TaxID=35761 RepID=UPI00260D5D8F|nr:TfoX/Sxy family protein [Nocardioides sp.]
MEMPKATDADKQRFHDLIAPLSAADPAVEVKPMFGQLGAFVHGNMFAGLFGDSVGIKLDETDAAALSEAGGGPFGPAERPMGGYLTIPASASAPEWLERSVGYVATFPPKAPKAARART